jgi:gliding motility-associated-like protein
VVDNDHVDISFFTDISAFVNQYRIFRSESPTGPFEEIGTVAPTNEETLSFTDNDAAINERSYYYKITVIDSCGIESEIGNIGRTIFLTVEGNSNLTNQLEWNGYESWDGNVDAYEIFRIVDGVPNPSGVLATVGPTELSYLDDISGVVITEGITEYYVRAVESGPNNFGFTDDAYSNIATAFQETSIFVPNAFAPEGINRTFKPVTTFVSSREYLFNIYNRFGQLIFETGDPSEGWDGKMNGEYVPQGVYVYVIRYRDTRNQPYVLKGTVTVVF